MGRIDQVEVLLAQAEQAHGIYEATVLQGVYDQAWPAWYAAYVVDHGIAGIVGHEVPVERVTELLATSWDDYRREQADVVEQWSSYAARRLAAEA